MTHGEETSHGRMASDDAGGPADRGIFRLIVALFELDGWTLDPSFGETDISVTLSLIEDPRTRIDDFGRGTSLGSASVDAYLRFNAARRTEPET